jgi:hypothetical protein
VRVSLKDSIEFLEEFLKPGVGEYLEPRVA